MATAVAIPLSYIKNETRKISQKSIAQDPLSRAFTPSIPPFPNVPIYKSATLYLGLVPYFLAKLRYITMFRFDSVRKGKVMPNK
jgi:hypothetical protein